MTGAYNTKSLLDEAQWWLSSAFKNKGKLKVSSIIDFYKDLAMGVMAAANRESGKFTEFDGKLSEFRAEFNFRNNTEMIMSASQLETLGKCPYEYFLKYILKIKVPDEVQVDAGVWLDPAARGSLLHSVFEKFYRVLKNKKEKPSFAQHESLINSITEKIIAEYRMEMVPPSEIVFQQEKMNCFYVAVSF